MILPEIKVLKISHRRQSLGVSHSQSELDIPFQFICVLSAAAFLVSLEVFLTKALPHQQCYLANQSANNWENHRPSLSLDLREIYLECICAHPLTRHPAKTSRSLRSLRVLSRTLTIFLCYFNFGGGPARGLTIAKYASPGQADFFAPFYTGILSL